MKLGIIAAMEQEVKTLADVLENKEVIERANQVFYNGFFEEKEITVVQSGIGKVNATIAATSLIETFHVDAIVNTGSAGGIGKNLSIGDLVISTELAYNDVDVRVFGYEYGQVPQMPLRYVADEKLVEDIKRAAIESKWKIETGLIVSGDSFISGEEKRKNIIEFFPEALVTEMEGAAIAQTCHQFNIPFVVVRALSDTANEAANITFDEFIELAGKHSAEMVLNLVKNLN